MFSSVPEILDELRQGRMVILTDDESRENEGDLVLPAQFVTPEAITFLLSVARGYLCISLTGADCDRLELHPQAAVNTTLRGTPFTVSIDGHPKHGFTTGVSARERARTIRMMIDPATGPDDFVRPGHINPLRSRDGGVLVRTGQTEGSLDLCRLAGLYPAACIIEIMRDDGEMARLPDLVELCRRHSLKMTSVNHIIQHRLQRESLVRRAEPIGGAPLKTEFGEFQLLIFESRVDALPHVVLAAGDVGLLDARGQVIENDEPTLVRVHRRNLLGDVFRDIEASPEGPTALTLHGSMRAIQQAGRGAILYLRPEALPSEVGLEQRLQTPRRGTFDRGADAPDLTNPLLHAENAVPALHRELGIGSQILRQLGITRLRLLTNHHTDWPGLEGFGLQIVERVPVIAAAEPGTA
jgi:3,4-dihydroxy 2-butanone 4-phosphate synthase / GTP cyclohydrolase II